jgi:hypothetical protein
MEKDLEICNIRWNAYRLLKELSTQIFNREFTIKSYKELVNWQNELIRKLEKKIKVQNEFILSLSNNEGKNNRKTLIQTLRESSNNR